MLVGISMAIAPGQACYIPLRHGRASASDQGLLDLGGDQDDKSALIDGQIDIDTAFDILRPLMADDAVIKIGHTP